MPILTTSAVIEREHFDPSLKDHREALKVFLTTNKWVKHFISDPNVHNLPYRLMVQTLLWYMQKDK
jgi:hypothetical protein